MKKLLACLALAAAAFTSLAPAAMAQDAASAPAAVASETTAQAPAPTAPAAATPAAPAASAPADAASAAAAAPPVINKGDTTWMMVSTLLVIMMTVPGLALFYGGLVRSKNMLSVLMQVMVTFSLIVVLWALYGYSLAFTEGNKFIGGFDRLFMKGIWDNVAGTFAPGATFSKGVYIPEIVFAAFQATFAGITCCLIVGAFAERIKFSAVLLFMVLWFTFSYTPMAHMVWFWMGPDAYSSAAVVDEMNSKAGLLWQWGALDFAGGTVVHINAASAGLIGAYLLGKRAGFGKEAFKPHNLPMVFTGASILYIGWFGFNAGSASAANGIAALAFLNTVVAIAGAILSWTFAEWVLRGKPSLLGACSGMIAGLVAVTPAAGTVGVGGALIIGLVGGVAGLWGVVTLKKWLKVDDTCDVFGVHGVCGIVGCLLTGVFTASSLGGTGYAEGVTMGHQVWIQLLSVVITLVWSSVAAFISFKIAGAMVGLRVPEEQEREGLDVNSHGESAYNQ